MTASDTKRSMKPRFAGTGATHQGHQRAYVWVRATVGYRKIGGIWMITHEHFSTPFEMEPPYKASLDLLP